MMHKRPNRCRKPLQKPSEDGYVLLAVMLMLALLIISMAVALPKMAASIQRDKERETFRRGMQYRRAVQLYYRKFNRYPPNIDALVKTNEIRFLRKKYLDPMTGKADWKPIMFGQNKTPMAMGFFGQPLGGIGMGGAVLGGTGPSGGNGIAGASPMGGMSSNSTGSAFGSSNSFGSSSSFGSGNSGFGATNTGATPTGAGATAATGGTDANGNPTTDPNTGSQPIGNGQTFGGGAIIGFSPASPKESIFVYKKKNHYNEWEFLYSPLSDQMNMGMGAQPVTQPSTPGVGSPGITNNPAGGIGVTPTPAPAPDQPQQ
jgi:type II secretory pathway pseudopilin PulG